MLSNREIVLETLSQYAADMARVIQASAGDMSGTELYDQEAFIPDFAEAVKQRNMLERKAGRDGFVCRSTAGRVVQLVQNYDSEIFTSEPEELPAQWGFKWSTDPAKALPFIALSTSPYNTGDCCTEDGDTFRSKYNGNVHAPSAWPDGWEKVVEA